jgi:hypothetical protein
MAFPFMFSFSAERGEYSWRFLLCSASALNVVNIGGVFVVLLCGLSVAILVAIVEFCWKARKMNTESHPMLGQVIIAQHAQYYFIHSHEIIPLKT